MGLLEKLPGDIISVGVINYVLVVCSTYAHPAWLSSISMAYVSGEWYEWYNYIYTLSHFNTVSDACIITLVQS